ncbi:hypothetical protein, partial [Pseudomonas viridiflava]|uniref:hypothetical protein n=1 Tax=Pseudomonas viridiflava TaxID=33069 RepID=UPI0013DF47DB
ADYLRRSRQQQVQERQGRPEGDIRSVQLANVSVTAKKQVVPPNDTRRLYPGVVANTLVDFTEIPSAQSGMSALQILQARVAGLTISGSPPNMT